MADTETIEDLVPEIDLDFLREKEIDFTATRTGDDVHIVVRGFSFPEQYTPRTADLLIILPAGYPNANLDMFWTRPDVKLANGNWPQNCDAHADYAGVTWQRWSRHFKTAWRQNVDSLRTFLVTIRKEIARGV